MGEALLISERFVAVFPSLVRALGSMSAAAIVQQVHYGVTYRPSEYAGETWTAVTAAELAEETGLSVGHVRRRIDELEKTGVLVSCQPEQFQRRKWYRIDLSMFADRDIDARNMRASEARNMRASSSTDVEDTPAAPSLPLDGLAAEPEPLRPAKPRARNLIYDALADVFPAATRPEQARVAKATADLRKLEPPPDPEDVRRRAEWVRDRFDNATVMAVTLHWTAAGEALAGRARKADPQAQQKRLELEREEYGIRMRLGNTSEETLAAIAEGKLRRAREGLTDDDWKRELRQLDTEAFAHHAAYEAEVEASLRVHLDAMKARKAATGK